MRAFHCQSDLGRTRRALSADDGRAAAQSSAALQRMPNRSSGRGDGEEGKRELVPMRWGLIPRWWSKTIKEAKMATFNARAETIETKPFFRDAFKRTRCLIPLSGYYEWQDAPGGKQPWYFTARDGSPLLTAAGPLGRVERSPDWRAAEVVHDDHHRAQRLRCGNPRSHAGVL